MLQLNAAFRHCASGLPPPATSTLHVSVSTQRVGAQAIPGCRDTPHAGPKAMARAAATPVAPRVHAQQCRPASHGTARELELLPRTHFSPCMHLHFANVSFATMLTLSY